MTADFLTPFVAGFGQLLGTANLGLTWRPDGNYTSADPWPIFVMNVPVSPPARPDCVTLSPYPLSEHPVYTDSTVGLQIRYRSPTPDIRSLWAPRDAVRSYLRGRFPLRLPTGLQVWSLTTPVGASMGQNDQKLWEWADSLTARCGLVHPVPA